MTIEMMTYRPQYRVRDVSLEDLPRIYAEIPDDASVAFAWNNLGDQVVMVGVGADFSVVTIKENDTFSDLVVSDDEGSREIEVAGQPTMWPTAGILPRETGLEVLLKTPRFDEIVCSYSWRPEE